MDTTTARLVDFASRSEFASLTADTVHECKRRLIDTLACAVGAYDEPVSQLARAVANRHSAAPGTLAASVWGSTWQTTPDAAAFANGVMLRIQDMSDAYRSKSGGHPSDVIAGVLAMGEAVHADGASVINAVTLAYDVYCSFAEAIDINSKGWDHTVYGGLACAVAAGKLLRLSREQMGHAISLALAPNMALFQTRHGDLSSWKGCAGANASRNAVFAALLARDGFAGPTAVFEGKSGLWDILGKFDWEVSVGPGTSHRVTRTHMKCFPICYHAQCAVWAAFDIRARLRVQDISKIQIETYRFAADFLGGDPCKWAPSTRETADHSMPYVVAIALLDGEVTTLSFADERLTDPTVVDLMRKVTVKESRDLSDCYPEASSCRLRVRTLDDREFVAEVRYPKGHINNPMDDTEITAKFRGMFRAYGNEAQCEAILDRLWNVEQATDIGNVLALFVRRS